MQTTGTYIFFLGTKNSRRAKWDSIWFKIERKTVTTIIFHSIWKEIYFLWEIQWPFLGHLYLTKEINDDHFRMSMHYYSMDTYICIDHINCIHWITLQFFQESNRAKFVWIFDWYIFKPSSGKSSKENWKYINRKFGQLLFYYRADWRRLIADLWATWGPERPK